MKKAAKSVGISFFLLFLYENGYLRPKKKSLEKIESFYQIKLDYVNGQEYPQKSIASQNKKSKPTKRRIIILGILSALTLGVFFGGATIFNESTSNVKSYFGDTYAAARDKAFDSGQIGRDIVTDLEYRFLSNGNEGSEKANILFYKKNSLLYFNNSIYSSNTGIMDMLDTLGVGRFQYQFGGALNRPSNLCTFTYGSSRAGLFFSCEVDFQNKKEERIENIKVFSESSVKATPELVTYLFNTKIEDVTYLFSQILTNALGKETSFYDDFLPSREQGRKTILNMQRWGLSLLIVGIISFFVLITTFLFTLIRAHQHKEIALEVRKDEEEVLVPKDINNNVAIPDFIILWLSRILGYSSIILLLFTSFGGMLMKLPPLFSDQTFLNFLEISFIISPFLRQLTIIRSKPDKSTLNREILKFSILHFSIATIESILIYITEMWGYDIGGFIVSYIPSSIFLVTSLLYLVTYFLFITPKFINTNNKVIIWRLLSLIPIGIIIATTLIVKAPGIFYNVSENIYVSFWFSNANVSLTIISILIIYTTFFINNYFEKKMGKNVFETFRSGDKYNLITNIICSAIILVVGLLDLAFINNEVAYYLGLGQNLWVLTLIPFVLLIKFGPNFERIALIDESILI